MSSYPDGRPDARVPPEAEASTRVPEDVLADWDAEEQRAGRESAVQPWTPTDEIPDDVRAERDVGARVAAREATVVPTDERVIEEWNEPEIAHDR